MNLYRPIFVSNIEKNFLHKQFINISFNSKHKANKVMFKQLILKINANPKL